MGLGLGVRVGLGLGVRVGLGLDVGVGLEVGVGVGLGVGVGGGRVNTLFCNSVKMVVLRRMMSESLVAWTVASVPGSK